MLPSALPPRRTPVPEVLMDYPIPSALDLHRIFNRLLIRRANLAAQLFQSPMEDLAPLGAEQSIYFSEPLAGLLVLRSSENFDSFLQGESLGSLLELTVLFHHQLFKEVWRLDTRKTKAALFKRSIPLQWPDRRFNTGCTLFVKDFPLEIRLWAPVTEEEMEKWRKSKT